MREKSERNGYLQEKYHLYGILNVDLVRVFFHNTQPLSLFMQRFSIHLGQNAIRKMRQWYLEWFLVQVSLNFISTHISNRLLIICSSWIMVSLSFENYIFVAIALIHCFLHRFGLIIMSSLKTMATVVGWVHSGPSIASCVLWPWAWVILLFCKDDKYSSILVPLHNNAPLLIFISLNCDNPDSVTTQASSLMELIIRHPAVRLLFMAPMWNESCLLICIIIY